MSFSYQTYVGPYVRCAVGAQTKVVSVRACLNDTCENHAKRYDMSGAFCVLCGSAIGDVPHTEIADAVDHWEVSESINERLCTAGGDAYQTWTEAERAHIWKPNVGDVGRHLDDREDWRLEEIGAGQIGEELAAFEAFFAPELDYMRPLYLSVTLHWGIIQDYL